MKRYYFIWSYLLLVACSSPDNKYVVAGQIEGGKGPYKYAILEKRDPLFGFQAVDTASVTDKQFVFEGKIDEPGMFFIKIDNGQRATVILEKGTIKMNYRADTIMRTKVSGTYNNEELMKFTMESMEFQKQIADFRDKNKERIAAANATKDTAAFTLLRKELTVLREKIDSQAIVYNDNYIKTHPKSFISALIVEDYIRRFPNEPNRVETAYKSLDIALKKTRVGKSIEKELANLKSVDVGEKAPDFKAPAPDGKIVSLYQSMGKVTVIDFWASWCNPCRIENPNMVKLYEEFAQKGLKIIGISLDYNAEAWKNAILKDKLSWTQISNLKKWDDPIVNQYGVEAIPATYVLNQYGVVVAKNLTGEALRAKVATLLKDAQATAKPQKAGAK